MKARPRIPQEDYELLKKIASEDNLKPEQALSLLIRGYSTGQVKIVAVSAAKKSA